MEMEEHQQQRGERTARHMYRADVARASKMLTAEEELELGKRVKEEGSKKAADALIVAFLPLADKMARSYWYKTGRKIQLDDLVQAANMGLMKAAPLYDYTLGFRFQTYARWWMREQLQCALLDERFIRLPSEIYQQLHGVLEKSEELAEQFGREPTAKEIAEALHTSPTDIKDLLSLLPTDFALSLDEPRNGAEESDDSRTRGDTISAAVLNPEQRALITQELAGERQKVAELNRRFAQELTPTQRRVFETYYTEGRDTFHNISRAAEELNRDPQSIHEALSRGWKKLGYGGPLGRDPLARASQKIIRLQETVTSFAPRSIVDADRENAKRRAVNGGQAAAA